MHDMDTGTSVSKGTFAFKGKKRVVRAEEHFQPCDDAGTWKRRLEGLQYLWEDIDTQIQILRADLNSRIFEDLLTFCETCHKSFTVEENGTAKHSQLREIPTAALVTGVNTPDHAVMFTTLITAVQERVSPLVATLKSKDCNNVKNILSKTLGQLLQNPQLFSDDEEEDQTKSSVSKNVSCTLSSLVTWYRDRYQVTGSSPKKRKSLSGSAKDCGKFPPIIIVFEDLECFLPRVLQDFIAICRNYLKQLPLVFVFGIATSVSAVHRLLPNAVSSMLCMEKFQAPPSTDYLTLVINKILMTEEFPFKLGSKVFQLLLDIFLYHDFSVLNFIKGLQFAMMDHYFTVPVSHLCCPLQEVQSQVRKLKHNELESLRRLGSFRTYVEKCPPEKQAALLLDDDKTKEDVKELISQIHQYHKLLYPVMRCLHTLVRSLPKHPLGKQLREVYSYVLGSNVCDSERYIEAMELLRMMSKDELTLLISQCKQALGTDVPQELSPIPTDLQKFLNRFDHLHEEVDDTTEETEDVALHLEKTSLHNLRKTLQEAGKKKKKQTPYEKLRTEIIDYFDNLFRKHLVCPKNLPLNEIFYYDSASEIKRHLNASPRSVVQMALSGPHHYLQCDCCKGEQGSISPTMPDVCIAYKLHLECSQLINLYDWLQAFVTVVTTDDSEENEEKIKNPDKEMQARFIRAVSELQFLGFVKPTKRKTDHVARLTWGGC